MHKKYFEKGVRKLRHQGYSKKKANKAMKGFAKRNRYYHSMSGIPWMVRYLIAITIEIVLFTVKVPTKDRIPIMLIQTIIPLSEATKPLVPSITIISAVMQIIAIILILDLPSKIRHKQSKK